MPIMALLLLLAKETPWDFLQKIYVSQENWNPCGRNASCWVLLALLSVLLEGL